MSLPPGFKLEEPTPQPAATSAAALPEGFTAEEGFDAGEAFEGQVTDTFRPRATTTGSQMSPDTLNANLRKLTRERASAQQIRDFVAMHNYTLDPETEDYLDTRWPQELAESQVPPEITTWDIQGPPREVGAGEAAWAGLKSSALRGFDDEWDAFWGATGNKLGTALGMNESDASFGDIYDQLVQQRREDKDAAWDQQTLMYSLGFAPGMFMGPQWARGGGSQPLSGMQRARQAATIGGIEGGLSAAGNADTGPDENFLNRAPDALFGITTGASLGPIADRLLGATIGAGGRMIRPVMPDRSVNSGLRLLSERTDVDPAAMRAEAERLIAAGVDPRLVDITTDEGRALIREVVERATPARAEVAEHAEGVYADAPDRIAAQANRISDDPRTANQMGNAAESARDSRMTDQMRPIRNDVVDIPEGDAFWAVMSTSEGRSAASAAARLETDPATKEALLALSRPQRLPDGYAEIAAQHDQVRALGLSPEAEARALAQLPPLPPIPERVVTVDMIDKISRGFGDAAQTAYQSGARGRGNVLRDYANDVRAAARNANPRYDRAVGEYSDASRVAEAARGENRFEETSFLDTAPDQFVEAARTARSEPGALPVTTPRDTTSRLERTGDIDPFLAEATDDGLDGGIFRYTSRSGDEIPFQVYFGEDGVAHIDLSMGEVPNALGPSEIRFLMADLQEMYPQIKSFEGFRISGARKAAQTRATQAQNRHFAENPEAYDRMGGIVSDLNSLAEHLRGEFLDVDIADVVRELRGMDPKVLGEALQLLSGARRDAVAHDLVERGIEFEMPRQVDLDQTVPALNASQMERTAPTRMTLSEEQAQRARWRDEVRTAAREDRGQGALPVARQIASGPAQRERNAAALGGRRAQELEEGMRGEVRRVENTRAIDPRAGNQPRTRGGRDAIVDGFTDAATALISAGAGGSRWPLVHTAARWLRHGGIRDVDAERLARDAISEDPARVEAAITYLEQRGMARARAQRFITTFASALTGRLVNSDSNDTPPPNSVRAVLREGNRQ